MNSLHISQIYDACAQTYDDSPLGGKNAVQHSVFKRFLSFLCPGSKVLDLGCGPGINASFLLETDILCKVTGVDISKGMIRRARETVPKASFFCRDILTIHLPEDAYDAVVVASVIFHLHPSELASLIRLIANALRPDGLLFVNFWSGEYSGFKSLDFTDRPMMVYYHDDSFLSHLMHRYSFGSLSLKKYRRELETSAGPETVTEVSYIGHSLKDKKVRNLIRSDAMYPFVY
ncbi:MAG: class I SAM-dependent methyltransferase [Peptococcaceae bacterium]|nr:class I SAM-dependent methyltransferase [Peptococcaceae bacterium]